MPSGQEYANRLREDAHRTLATQVNDLEQELNNIKNDLSLSLGQLGEKLEAVRNFALPEAETVVLEALEEASREKNLESASLTRFAHDIRAKETQEEILNFLLDEAAKFSPRLVLYVVRGGKFAGWSSRGFSQKVAEEISQSTFDQAASPLCENSMGSDGVTTASDLTGENALKSILEESLGPWHLFPLKAIRRPVALLLAAGAEGRSCNLASLSMLLDLTGLCLENIALRILHEMHAQPKPTQQKAKVEAAPAQRSAEIPAEQKHREVTAAARDLTIQAVGERSISAPEEAVAEKVVVEAALVPESPAASAEPMEMAEVAPEQTMESAVAAPQEQATMAAIIGGGWVQETAQKDEPVAPATSSQPEAPPVLEEAVPAEEEKAHSDAKRFARLLVSEIKLYNEQRVIDGRQNKDLYVRLKKDIDKSREMYDKRVSPLVTQKIDYFHDEVVRILGENDVSALGSDYPGPRVES